MTWEDILKQRMTREGISEEHRERLRAMPSTKQPMFDKRDNPYDMIDDKVDEIIDSNKLEMFLQMSQAQFMRSYDVKQFTPAQPPYEKIEKMKDELMSLITELLDKYREEAERNQGENPLPKYDPKGI